MTDNRYATDVVFIEALAELLRQKDLTEIEVERTLGEADTLSVRVTRRIEAPAVTVAAPAPAPAATPAQPAAPTPEPAAAPAPEDPALDPRAVTSPMVGTVYLQAEPGAAAFVKPGDSVSEGQTLMIIEAMKTMNQIPAPRSGKVSRILVEDGSPVEFGAPLLILD